MTFEYSTGENSWLKKKDFIGSAVNKATQESEILKTIVQENDFLHSSFNE